MALQETVRDLDSGFMAQVLKIGMIVVVVIGLCIVYLLMQFKGLGTEHAMDQAQIARSLISGEGFTTRYIRPLAIRQLTDTARKVPSVNFPDFYNAPLYPLVEAAALFPVKKRIAMAPTDTLSMGDRAIATLGIVLLLLSVLVWYFVGALLFDRTLALIGAGLLLVTDLLWQYALAGLPQLFLTVLFGLVCLCALKALNAEEEDNQLAVYAWLGGGAFGLGLMSLTHGVTSFLVPGFLAFCLFAFRSRVVTFLLPFLIYLLTVLPWLLRNYSVCGNPFGLSIYMALAGSGVTEQSVMRGVNTGLTLGGGMASKIRSGLLDQASHLWEYLGLNITVVAFFISLLHPFKNPVAAIWRWVILIMWIGLTLGMALFGVKGAVSGNQLHVIFIPIFILFGTAFILVLWNRLNISLKPLRIAFLTAIFLISGIPMILTLLTGQQARIQWPPYVPPFISVLQTWFKPQELLSSDMPWAVAWYANRKCLLIPETVRQFNEISDFGSLSTPIVGLYLTPVSAGESFMDLLKGSYKDWGPVIMRTVNPNDFLLKSFTPLPIDGECILYADTERWARKSSH
jgi:4-amino-4-deoxy-L-arabinose transferase-like glycosyltransferase